jgi:hypothetical protein
LSRWQIFFGLDFRPWHSEQGFTVYQSLLIITYLGLHYSGQVNMNTSKFLYVKERNNDVYEQIQYALKKPHSLKTSCLVVIRNSIKCFGINKINQLEIPNALKHELFLNQMCPAVHKGNISKLVENYCYL